ncbi:MAG: SGNH/GDSL hydrolase family protein [Sphingobacteriaceae bacterium]|nr:SGNH/GDSL hydrolase family protein [Sphingobacteriaceae bacterium]
MNWETILFIGDSITNGARSYLSFAEYTGDMLEKTTGKTWNIMNFSCNGITANDLNKLVTEDFGALSACNSSLVVVLIGTNDAKEQTNEVDFRIAYNQLLTKAKLLSQNKNVLVVKLPQFQKGIMLPYQLSMNTSIEKYNQIISELVEKHKVFFVEIDCGPEHFFDGVHLNREGALHFASGITELILSKRGI